MDESFSDDLDALLGTIEEDVKKIKEEKEEKDPALVMEDKEYMKKVFEGVNQEDVQKIYQQLQKGINNSNKEERTLFRQRLVTSYWGMVPQLVQKIISKSINIYQRLCLRYGIINPDYLTSEQKEIFKSIPFKKTDDTPFYYMDEWFEQISEGKIKPSMTDEISRKKSDTTILKEKLERKKDAWKAELNNLKSRAQEREMLEKSLLSEVKSLITHSRLPHYDNVPDVYTPQQKELMSQIQTDLRKLKTIDSLMAQSMRTLRLLDEEISSLQSRIGTGETIVDGKTVIEEFNSVRQMIKMCIGPRGNHFPILIKDYCPNSIRYIGTRENIIKEIEEIEKRDPNIFIRTYKGQKNRIVPFIILVPAYGDKGICWEPFDMKQRATSRGRLAIPMYPRNLRVAILSALGDLRWQLAKEKASYRWMEEGLTGKYYEYFTSNKLKGNIKDEFIKDYIIWITYEWEGMQKLHRDVRFIFWREMPFPQWKKEELKNRGFFYADLYKRDQRRAMSDGYI